MSTIPAGQRKGQVKGDLPTGWRDQTAVFTAEECAELDLGPSYKRDDKTSYYATVAEDAHLGWRWDVVCNDDRGSIAKTGWTTTAIAGIRAADKFLIRFP